MLSKDTKKNVVEKFGANNKDTGSVAVQVALLTKRIEALTLHLKNNKGDASARRSLLIQVGKRRSLLNYIATHDHDGYEKLIQSLGLRK